MSMKRLAILAAVGPGGIHINGTGPVHPGGTALNMTTSSGGGGGGSKSGTAGGGSLHGNFNVLLGGAMLSGIILVVILICYCCHRNMRKNTSQYVGYWREPEVPMEVFTLAGQTQCYESSGLFISEAGQQQLQGFEPPRPPTPGPPPAYEAVVGHEKDKFLSAEVEQKVQPEETKTKCESAEAVLPSDESGLPSYEAALRLEASGYV